jgi:formylglycine-generating enzyme required for sulfatase activity
MLSEIGEMDGWIRKKGKRQAPWGFMACLALSGCNGLLGISEPNPRNDGDSGRDAALEDAIETASPDSEIEATVPPIDGGPAFGAPCTTPGELACAGYAQHLQLICKDNVWSNAGTCPGDLLCDTETGSKQGTCQPPVPECMGRKPGDLVCIGSGRYRCGPDLLTASSSPCPSAAPTCVGDGACRLPPSCAGGDSTCGPQRLDNCCESIVIPGGAFYRNDDEGTHTNHDAPATVSDFRLDRFEVTVKRFRAFLNHDPRFLPDGAGANPHAPGTGWQSSWNANLPIQPDTASGRACTDAGDPMTFTFFPSDHDTLPMNCINWYEAFLFCQWDGNGRLPTIAEWNYAAAGGAEQRAYPWSNPPSDLLLDPAHANYGCDAGCANAALAVGSDSPAGDGRWGHADLSGNVREWVFDYFSQDLPVPCADCALILGGPTRGQRGGGFKDSDAFMQVAAYTYANPLRMDANVGFRCVHPL